MHSSSRSEIKEQKFDEKKDKAAVSLKPHVAQVLKSTEELKRAQIHEEDKDDQDDDTNKFSGYSTFCSMEQAQRNTGVCSPEAGNSYCSEGTP